MNATTLTSFVAPQGATVVREGAMPEAGISRSAVAAAVAGNALEFYDFVTFTFFAIQIGHAFFPSHSAYVSLMASLAASSRVARR